LKPRIRRADSFSTAKGPYMASGWCCLTWNPDQMSFTAYIKVKIGLTSINAGNN
jgi:hypothetical protein